MKTLFEAIESGDVGEVWQAVKAGAPLDEIDGNTELTPLALAAEAGYTEIVRILLSAEADPNLGGATTPLEAAVVEGHIETVSALLESGAEVNLAVEDGFTPLMTAAATGDLRLVRCLLDAGARPRKTNDDGDTAITLAQEEGHDAVVKLLRSRRRKAPTEESVTPEKAPESDAEPVGSGAGEKEEERGGESLGSVAREPETPKEETSSAQEASSADVDSMQPEESLESTSEPTAETQVEATASKEDEEESRMAPEDTPGKAGAGRRETPTEQGPTAAQSPPPADRSKATALETTTPETTASETAAPDTAPAAAPIPTASHRLAESKVMIEKLEILKKRIAGCEGALNPSAFEDLDLEGADSAGYRPLMAAAYFGELEVVAALLEMDVEVDATDTTDYGLTALAWAAHSESTRRLEILTALARAGAQLDKRCGHNQRTALMHAADADVNLDRHPQERFAATTRHLVELGAQTEITDRRGLTVWRLIKRDALGARTSTVYRRRLHQMLRILEYCGARPIASHAV